MFHVGRQLSHLYMQMNNANVIIIIASHVGRHFEWVKIYVLTNLTWSVIMMENKIQEMKITQVGRHFKNKK